MTTRLHSRNMTMSELLRRTNARLDQLEKMGQWIGAYVVAHMENPVTVGIPTTQNLVTLLCQIELPRGRWMVHGTAVYRQTANTEFRGMLALAESIGGGWPEFSAPIGLVDTSDAVDIRPSTTWNGVALATPSVRHTYLLDGPAVVQLGAGRGSGVTGVTATAATLVAQPG